MQPHVSAAVYPGRTVGKSQRHIEERIREEITRCVVGNDFALNEGAVIDRAFNRPSLRLLGHRTGLEQV
jgi:hypothetical protein